MSLADDLLAAETVAGAPGGRICPVCNLIADLQAKEHADLLAVEQALGGTIGERTLCEILRKHGFKDPKTGLPIGRSSLGRHRREGHQ